MDGYYSGPYKAPNSVLVSIFFFKLSFPTSKAMDLGASKTRPEHLQPKLEMRLWML